VIEEKLLAQPDSPRLNAWLNRCYNREKNDCFLIRNIGENLKENNG